jgi:hypothetical protein
MIVSCVARDKRRATRNQALKSNLELLMLARAFKVIGSSDKVHVVDALAITGEEGRGSLRKASGSWQTSFDPRMSEWGNPARKGHFSLNT